MISQAHHGKLQVRVESLPAPTVTAGASGPTPMTAPLQSEKIGYDGFIHRRLLVWVGPAPGRAMPGTLSSPASYRRLPSPLRYLTLRRRGFFLHPQKTRHGAGFFALAGHNGGLIMS